MRMLASISFSLEPAQFSVARVQCFFSAPPGYGSFEIRARLWLHESGTYVKLTDAGAALFA
jgi:hypothetical protein